MLKLQNSYKIKRTFFIENEVTSQSQIIDTQIETDGTKAQILSPLVNFTNLSQIKFKIFDNDKLQFVSLDKVLLSQNFIVPFSYVQFNIIMMKWTIKLKPQSNNNSNQIHNQESQSSISSASSSSSVNSETKKERSSQRTIGQVIKLVKQWRDIHLNSGINPQTGKKNINLQQSAKALGVSKKTLDDYYYHLRVGELNSFPFKDHLDDKIGVLRKSIKNQRGTKQKKSYHKHPKKLQIINKMEQEDQLFYQKKIQNQDFNQIDLMKDQQKELQNPIGDLRNIQVSMEVQSQDQMMKQYENKFFLDFEFLNDQPDPFFNFQKSFQKKQKDIFYDSSFY